MPNLYIGLMSGTSMDAIDAVLADFSADPPKLIGTYSQPISAELRDTLLSLSTGGEIDELERTLQLDVNLGRMFATTANNLLHSCGAAAEHISAIGCHGQTLRHQPNGQQPYSLQIGNPALIAELTGITTVADFRSRDIAAGGQGAPLAPAFHAAVFHTADVRRVIVNIGGMANITVLPGDSTVITGFDTGPGNVLMDAWAWKMWGERWDSGGQRAASGTVHPGLLTTLLADPYFALAPPKSTGREYFNLNWLETRLTGDPGKSLSAEDIQATLCALTAVSLARAITHYAPQTQETLICGGGVHNTTLFKSLRSHLGPIHVESTAVLGIDPAWIEAFAFAWLAKQAIEGKPGNLPGVTGARRAVILGGIYRA